VSRKVRHINQKSFQLSTTTVNAAEYAREQVAELDHILLDFDHKEIRVKGQRAAPPKLHGVSGGGIFHLSRSTRQGPLIAIATENRRNSRLIVGTLIRHFVSAARELAANVQRD